MKRKYKTTPYQRGYHFERRVKKHYEDQGFYVIRQGKSAFPDLIVMEKESTFGHRKVIMVECKIGKYLSADEWKGAKELNKLGFPFAVAWRDGRKLKIDTYAPGELIEEE